jgi:hypothetical protein
MLPVGCRRPFFDPSHFPSFRGYVGLPWRIRRNRRRRKGLGLKHQILRGVLGGATLVLLASGCAGATPQNATTGLGAAVHGNAETAAAPATPAAPERVEAAPAARAVPGPVVTRGMERNIVLEGQDVGLHCDDGGSIDIEASGVILVVTGHCQEIEVLGAGVTVRAEIIDEIYISGNGNTVNAAEAAELTVEGDSNSITLGAVGEIEAAGRANSISFESGGPDTADTGEGNSIVPA